LATASFYKKVADIESRLGARIGIFISDHQTGQQLRYRAEERFPLNSTVKAFACAHLLARVDAGQEQLDRTVAVRKSDLVAHSPVTEPQAGRQG
jgi:beta-lactamase class A